MKKVSITTQFAGLFFLLCLLLSCEDDILRYYDPPTQNEGTNVSEDTVNTGTIKDSLSVDTVANSANMDTVTNTTERDTVVSNSDTDAVVNVIASSMLGVWEEPVDTTLYYFAKSEYRVELLKNDSFNIEIYGYTDMNSGGPCGLSWTHYASGKIVDEDPLIDAAISRYNSDVLLFRGNYTDASYTYKSPNCRGQELYSELFSVT